MEEKIEALYNYIINQEERYLNLKELLGYNHNIVVSKGFQVLGMEMAFKALTGYNITEHVFACRRE